ncbi:MAG: hypothetical protein KDI66_20365, partial [Xanthomonadales bacterium]|nr:hypothetical protein [Xanthomonadales bacterium]
MTAFVCTRGAATNAPVNARRIGEPVIVESEYQFASGVGPASGDTFDVGYWPANHVLEPDLCRVRFE